MKPVKILRMSVIPRPTARRILRLIELRLDRLGRLLEGQGDDVSAADLERQARVLTALLKALETTARMAAAAPEERGEKSTTRDDANIRRRLAQRLEGLLAGGGPPRPAARDDAGGDGAD